MTRRIDIDFAPASVARSLRSSGWRVWLLALSGLLLSLSAAIYWQGLVSKRVTLQGEITAVERQVQALRGRVVAAPPEPLTEAQVLAMNGITSQLNLPWRALLNAMEAAGPGGQDGHRAKADSIALLELDPDPKNQLIKGLAEARNSAAMLGYIERLKAQTAFGGARLIKHEYMEPDANAVIRFEFEVIWPGHAP